MPRLVKNWLEPFDWEFVTEINRGLCRQKNALHKATSDGHEPARKLWKSSQRLKMDLVKAVEVCFQCHRLAPFCFYNGNTFAAIARDLVMELAPHLSPDRLHVLRSIAGHIVAGTAEEAERREFATTLQGLED